MGRLGGRLRHGLVQLQVTNRAANPGGGVVEVECSGALHRITAAADTLLVHDHDVAAELALHRLGGRVPTCLDILDAWLHPEVLDADSRLFLAIADDTLLSDRGRDEVVERVAEETMVGFRHDVECAFRGTVMDAETATGLDALALRSHRRRTQRYLPAPLRVAFVAMCCRALAEEWRLTGTRPAALAGPELLLWKLGPRLLHGAAPEVPLPVSWPVLAPGAPPSLPAEVTDGVGWALGLSIDWFVEVWPTLTPEAWELPVNPGFAVRWERHAGVWRPGLAARTPSRTLAPQSLISEG